MAGFVLAAGTVQAQQVLVGTVECPVVAEEAVCTGDLLDGVIGDQTIFAGALSTITIRDVTGPIEPAGIYGIGADRSNGSLTINVADDVVINTYDDPAIANPAQGIIAIVRSGFDAAVDSGAAITVDGRGQPVAGIEVAVFSDASNIGIVNRGSVTVSTTDQFGAALVAQAGTSSGNIDITNSGALDVTTGPGGRAMG
ncbi:hypothetical protein [Croceicoccus sp. Ery15]|uniref:hypothetical protein n=1 Tax=Croceicoccus sp. Ery15 TaxID=1703338 RepID=UPI001E5924EE|nr:hypothetical protein [Croceicoccus sp. Ery15]